MKKSWLLIVAALMVLGSTSQSQASLTVVGTDSVGNQLIYDSALNVTWYDFTYSKTSNGENWNDAKTWASNLIVNFNGKDFSGWSLPTSFDGKNTYVYNGIISSNAAAGYNIKDTRDQMSYLYYAELGNGNNKGYLDINGQMQNPSWNYGLAQGSATPFKNLIQGGYWSNQAASLYSGQTWIFNTSQGSQFTLDATNPYQRGIAVLSGDISAVPVPAAGWLLGSSLAGLAAVSRRKRS